jgi:hypothetical protein
MRRLAYSLLLISSHAVAGTTIDPPPAPDGALRGNVVVWHDAKLFAEPSESARTLHLATFDSVARKDRVGHVVALKVVASKGAFVEVELTGQEDCTSSRVVVPADLARFRMFVRRADIAPVLVKPFAKTYPDGTSVSLAVGTPVVPTDAGTYVVSLRGDVLEVDVPSASVGHAYGTLKARSAMNVGSTLAIAQATKATLGERSLGLTAWQGAPVERRGETALVALDGGCIVARVIVPAKSLSDADEALVGLAASTEHNDVVSLRDELFLPKLTAMMVGARQVALAAKPIYLQGEPMGQNACVQRAVRIDSLLAVTPTEDKLRLCAPAKKIVRESLRSAKSAPR